MGTFDINVEPATVATALCGLMRTYRGDKGSDDGTSRHNYTLFYNELFAPRRQEPLRILELGVFCGASVRAWRDFFPNAEIVGLDINPGSMVNEDRIRSVLVDSTSAIQLVGALDALGTFDVIVDDGPHNYIDNRNFLYTAYNYLRPGGVFVIEDIVDPHEYLALATEFSARIVQMPVPTGSDATDNNLMVLVKP